MNEIRFLFTQKCHSNDDRWNFINKVKSNDVQNFKQMFQTSRLVTALVVANFLHFYNNIKFDWKFEVKICILIK